MKAGLRVFGRRTKATTSGATALGATETDATRSQSKGRATPTRKEAEAARKQRLAAPRTRKELNAKQRAETKEMRRRQQLALSTGDEQYLPARDKGPVKRFARDYVDSRRTVGEFMLPLFFVAFALSLISTTGTTIAAFGWLLIIAAMVADGWRLSRGVKAAVSKRFGSDQTKGIGFYALMRGWQMRRLRLPKPQVEHGAKV